MDSISWGEASSDLEEDDYVAPTQLVPPTPRVYIDVDDVSPTQRVPRRRPGSYDIDLMSDEDEEDGGGQPPPPPVVLSPPPRLSQNAPARRRNEKEQEEYDAELFEELAERSPVFGLAVPELLGLRVRLLARNSHALRGAEHNTIAAVSYVRGATFMRTHTDPSKVVWPGEDVADASPPGGGGGIRNTWMPASEHEDPVLYAARLRDCALSIVDLLYVMRGCIVWTNVLVDSEGKVREDNASMAKAEMDALDKVTFRIGRCDLRARGYNVRYDNSLFIPLLCAFRVCNAKDVGRTIRSDYADRVVDEHADHPEPWVGALIRIACNACWARTINGDLHHRSLGPEVRWIGGPRGYGLFAQRAYLSNSVIVMYGGQVLSQDPASAYETDEERAQHCSPYTLPLIYLLDEPPAARAVVDPVVDSELFWRLTDTGRFANQAERASACNADFLIVCPDEGNRYSDAQCAVEQPIRDIVQSGHRPYAQLNDTMAMSRVLVLRARGPIRKGQEICVDYGPVYLNMHMKGTGVQREYEERFGSGAGPGAALRAAPESPGPVPGAATSAFGSGAGRRPAPEPNRRPAPKSKKRLKPRNLEAALLGSLACVACGVKPAAAACRHCRQLMYCTQACADGHWAEHIK